MARGDRATSPVAETPPWLFPPELVRELRFLAPRHDIAIPLHDEALKDLLSGAFFASLRSEEGEHHALRIALLNAFEEADVEELGWRLLRFKRPVACNARQLVRLARAAPSMRLFVAVAWREERLLILGLARENGKGQRIKLVSPEPGCLEVWSGSRRILEYAQGRVVPPPEDVLLSAGSVRSALLKFAHALSAHDYLESVRSLIREVSAHSYGGILVITADTCVPADGFVLASQFSIGALLEQLAAVERDAPTPRQPFLLESLRGELERTIAEVGRLTALDGATVLDRQLSVLGFGVILPVVTDINIVEARDAAASDCVPFPLAQYGARHQAAASYASMHPGSVVLLVSADGDMACLLRTQESPHVVMWRFRSDDLTSADM